MASFLLVVGPRHPDDSHEQPTLASALDSPRQGSHAFISHSRVVIEVEFFELFQTPRTDHARQGSQPLVPHPNASDPKSREPGVGRGQQPLGKDGTPLSPMS